MEGKIFSGTKKTQKGNYSKKKFFLNLIFLKGGSGQGTLFSSPLDADGSMQIATYFVCLEEGKRLS